MCFVEMLRLTFEDFPDASFGYTFVYRDHKQIQFRYSICLAWYIFKRIKFEIEVRSKVYTKSSFFM